MKIYISKPLLFLLSGLFLFLTEACQAPQSAISSRSKTYPEQLQDLRVDVVYLASDNLKGRLAGTDGEKLAAQYIANRFEAAGLQAKGTVAGEWIQVFPFREMTNPHTSKTAWARKGEARNVIGYLDHKAKTTVVIGAHYDHLGVGGSGSLHSGEPEIHNGADDNASGVAAMIYLSQELKKPEYKNNNYLFIAFSAEELGLFGSKYFAENPTIDWSSVNYMLNMDMVGRLNDERVLVVNGVGTSPNWTAALERSKGDLILTTTESGIGASDHTSFYLKDIPALHFFTGQHSNYHKPSDDAHLINYEGIHSVANCMLRLIKDQNKAGKLTFTKTKDSQERQAAAFKVTLGVMPDYVYQGKGMRIDGVLDGRPAAAAGLEAGDIVVKIGDLVVDDIYGYMEGLSKFNKGEETTVVVKRGEEELEKAVVF